MVAGTSAGGRDGVSVDAWRRYWRGLDWIEELSYLALLATEACVIYPWQSMLNAWLGHQAMPLWALCALLWAAYLAASVLNRSELPLDRKQAITAILLIVSALVTVRAFVYAEYAPWELGWVGDMANRLFTFAQFPPDLVGILLVFFCWWRGIVAARKGYDTPAVWFHFRVGVISMFAALFFAIFGTYGETTPVILAFFFFGLISIALARIIELGGIHASTLGSQRWMAVLVGSTLGSLGLSILAALTFSPRTLRVLFDWLLPLRQFLSRIAWLVVGALLYLAFPLFEWALSWIKRTAEQQAIFGESLFGSPLIDQLEVMETEGVGSAVPVCRAILVVAIVIGGLLLVARAIRRLAQEQAKREKGERESLLSEANVLDDLRNSLRDGLAQLRGLAGQFSGRHRRSIASIREIYASMVDLATEAGYPRRAAETPYEYRGTLYAAFAGGEKAVDAITEAYVRTHYGEVPDTPSQMAQIVHAWEQLRTHVTPQAKDADST